MKKFISLFRSSCLVAVLSVGLISSARANEQQKLDQLLQEIWAYELSQFPSLARSKGQTPEAFFTDQSLAAKQARHQKFLAFAQQLEQVDAEALTNTAQISLLMQQYRLADYIDRFTFKEYLVPITSEYGFHASFSGIPDRTQINNQDDLVRYIAQLNAIPAQFTQQIDYMREGMSVGMVQPQIVLQGFEDSIKAMIVDEVEDSRFFAPITAINDWIKAAQKAQATEAVNKVNRAYQAFYDFMVNDYIPAAKTDISVKTWPQGEAFYNNRIKHFTTTDMTAEQIHALGLQEVARIRAEMQNIVDKLKFDGDINEFIEFLRSDPQFYASSADDLLKEAAYIAKKMDAELPKLFKKLPRTPYGVAPVPDSIAPKYTTGRYISPRTDKDAGYYWVNTYALDKRPLYALPALTLHEAVPGHHLQISLAAEMENLPEVRRSTYISAFGEGWGLYSEYLGVEVGIYDDPYDDFGRLSYEMWRACRLVVDTGMHMFGWSREKALNYMLENTALSAHNVQTEIDRYISWPAQALSYKIGEIKIKQLHSQAEQALGDNFDIRDFHDAVLAHGSVPLFVLEQNMLRFIEEQQNAIP